MTLKSCHDDRDPGPKKLLVLENSWSWKTLLVSRVMNAMRRAENGDCRNGLKFRVPLASRCSDKDFDVRYILLASGLILDASLTGRAVARLRVVIPLRSIGRLTPRAGRIVVASRNTFCVGNAA